MKKFLVLSVLLTVVLATLSSCGPSVASDWKDATYRIDMISDSGTIDDESFNQGTWEGIQAFAAANSSEVKAKYLKPGSINHSGYLEAMYQAIKIGANIIVCPGYLFETAVYEAQSKHPNVKFILIDGEPHDPEYKYETKSNVVNILFKEEQAGFLAGYGAVLDGFRNFGFLGGMAVPAVKRFGEGFVAGIYQAAKDSSIPNADIHFPKERYGYLGNFKAEVEHKTKAKSWYDSGTEVIFAAAGGAGASVFEAARESGDTTGTKKYVIGVDVDQASKSTDVISSAMKGLSAAVNKALGAIKDGTFEGGVTWTLGAESNAVQLSKGDSWKWKVFTEAQYNEVFAKVASGTIVVPDNVLQGSALTAFVSGLGYTLAAGLADYVVKGE